MTESTPCPEDPSGHGLHWRNIGDSPGTCHACGRGDVEARGPGTHLTRAFGIGQGFGRHPKPQDRRQPSEQATTPPEPLRATERPAGPASAQTTDPQPVDPGPERLYGDPRAARLYHERQKRLHWSHKRIVLDHLYAVRPQWIASPNLQKAELLCTDGEMRMVGTAADRRARELAEDGYLDRRHEGRYAEYRYPEDSVTA